METHTHTQVVDFFNFIFIFLLLPADGMGWRLQDTLQSVGGNTHTFIYCYLGLGKGVRCPGLFFSGTKDSCGSRVFLWFDRRCCRPR